MRGRRTTIQLPSFVALAGTVTAASPVKRSESARYNRDNRHKPIIGMHRLANYRMGCLARQLKFSCEATCSKCAKRCSGLVPDQRNNFGVLEKTA